jgi:hypothetical protein
MCPLPAEDESEFSVGGFQGIKKLRGLLVDIDVVDPPESWENRERQVVKVSLEDTVVLEMFGDEETFELKDGKFNFYIPYAAPGAKPHANSIYSKCWIASAKELGFAPSQKIGEYITLEKQPRLLFKQPIFEDVGGKKTVKLDDDGNKIYEEILAVNESGRPNHFCFVGDESAESENIKDYIVKLVSGLNEKAALRKLLVDQKAKQFPEYKDKMKVGAEVLAEYLGLIVVDGKFAKPESGAEGEADEATG